MTAAAPEIPAALRDQLADGARLVIPVGGRSQVLTVMSRRGMVWTEEPDVGCVFVPLVGAEGFRDEKRLSQYGPAPGGAAFGGSCSVYSAGHDPRLRRPHPDDVALSCGGLIASLRELGQNVTILTVFSGDGANDGLSPYQREALGFGSKAMWPATEAFNRSDILADWPTAALVPSWAADEDRLDATQADADAAAKRFWQRSSWYRRASVRNESLADQPVIDDVPTQGAVYTDEVMAAAAAGDLMARRRVEDERFAYFAEASIVFLDLPDAVFRGYEGDEELLGMPRGTMTTPRTSSCAARSPGSSRRRSTCRSASAATSTTSSAGTSASGSSRRAVAG